MSEPQTSVEAREAIEALSELHLVSELGILVRLFAAGKITLDDVREACEKRP